MREYSTEIWSPALNAAGTVMVYGHYGRPALVFPSEAGRAWDFANNGMVGAVADLIEAGRVKLYCVDSFDAGSWSARDLPLEERARRHGGYESWIVDQVVPHIAGDSGGGTEIMTVGASMGAYHALNFAFKSPASRPTSTIPATTWPTCTATTSTGCAHACRSCWSAGRASGRTPPARWTRPGGSPGCSQTRASSTSWTCGGTTSRTTGRPGAGNWHTTCRGSVRGSHVRR